MNNEERAKRLAAMKEEKEKQLKKRAMVKKYGPFALGGLCVLLIAGVIIVGTSAAGKETSTAKQTDTSVINEEETVEVVEEDLETNDLETVDSETENLETEDLESEVTQEEALPTSVQVGDVTFKYGYTAEYPDNVVTLGDEVVSDYAILINVETGEVVAKKASQEQMVPASMTKILTVLVAAENIDMDDLDTEVTVGIESTDFSYSNGCSSVGFLQDEVTTLRDLFYGTILPSGGDAAHALATYVAGSHENFVEMMNDKLEELGLSDTTHFTNCVGIYNKEHYTTVYDMAMIIKAAVENDFVREVMSTHTYVITGSEHEDGITESNWFLRRIEDKETGGEVIAAKTGFVNQSGSCAASYFVSESGVPYVCVTGSATSSWKAIYDHVYIYKTYAN